MKRDWQTLTDELGDGEFKSIMEVSKFLGIPYRTVYDAFSRGDLPFSLIKEEKGLADEEVGKVSFRESGNEAILKFNAAEPLSAGEAMEVAGVDKKLWRIVDQRVNMWQIGRKDKSVSLEWRKGKVDGFVEDSGKIHKAYLYQIEVKLTRIKRVPVKLETLKPIEMNFRPRVISNLPPNQRAKKILFIADPHFGFRRTIGKLQPIHHRPFLGSLLNIAGEVKPDAVVWNGDVLDLADFSTFDTAPELLQTTQLAGLELAWVLAEFRNMARRQIVLEGNHEKRMQRMLIKHFSASYQLKPVHDLEGESLMSVSRFLGLDKIWTEWIGDYPSNYLKINSARFYHGNMVRKGSAKTVAAEMAEATSDRFFGHIHRFELASKYIPDLEREIFVGSPGCACDKRFTPGADLGHNWQLGAFLIHLEKDYVAGVERISSQLDGLATFRGCAIEPADYLPEFLDSIPSEYRDQF